MDSQRMAQTASQAKVSSACSGLRQPAWTVRPEGQLGVALLMPPTRMARATSSPTSHSASECEGLVRGPSVTLSEGQRWQHPCQGPPWHSVLCSWTQRWQHEMLSLPPGGQQSSDLPRSRLVSWATRCAGGALLALALGEGRQARPDQVVIGVREIGLAKRQGRQKFQGGKGDQTRRVSF